MAKKIINIVITAGGTTENIDKVRTIKNTSTGKLGALICEKIVEYMSDKQQSYYVHYVIANGAIKPNVEENIKYYEVSDSQSVEIAVGKILSTINVDYFIHSMAISDFTPSIVVDVPSLVDELAKCFRKSNKNTSEIEIRKDIEKILRTPENKINNHNKINSEKELLLMLSPTPKIISCIKKDGRNPYLVGFKLLNNVTEEELLNAANKQADSNGCDLVLANDLKFINEGTHIGLLIKNGEIISKLLGKEAIAIGIVEEMFKSLKEKNNYCTF